MPNTPKAVRIIKPHIANPMYCAICLKFAVAVISSLFLIFLFLMRIQELRELSFKLSYLPLVYPTFFLCVYRLSKFCLLVDTVACGGKKGLFALWVKNTSRRSGDFSAKRQKNSPAPHVYNSEQATLPGLILPHNLELRLRDGENEWQHIGTDIPWKMTNFVIWKSI